MKQASPKLFQLWTVLGVILIFLLASCQPPTADFDQDEAAKSLSAAEDRDDENDEDDEGSKRIVAYYISWGIYGRNYTVPMIPARKLTHLIYAFANISSEGVIAIGDSWADIDKPWPDNLPDLPFGGNFNQLVKLKQSHPHLKTLIAVGGWTWSDRFSDIALTVESRQKFAASCVQFIRTYRFDGIDIDWEYPVAGGLPTNKYRPEDKQNFTLLLAELRAQLDAAEREDGKRYLLSAATAAGSDKIINLELDKIHRYLDWINLMTFDFHGGWDAITNHHTPLYANPLDPSPNDPPAYAKTRYNTNSTVKQYRRGGVPAHKLVLGMPFYGRGWKEVPAENQGLFQSAGGVPMGTWGPDGFFDFSDLEENIIPYYQEYWDPYAKASWLYLADKQIMISYESTRSCRLKCRYILENELGGAMFWEITADRNHTLLNILNHYLSEEDD